MGRSLSSVLGIIAAILVIVAAVYYLTNEADDSELEIDIGMVQEAPPSTPVIPAADFTSWRIG